MPLTARQTNAHRHYREQQQLPKVTRAIVTYREVLLPKLKQVSALKPVRVNKITNMPIHNKTCSMQVAMLT